MLWETKAKRTKTQKISCDYGKIWIKCTKTQKISCNFGKYWIKRTKTQKISCDYGKIWIKRTKTQKISCDYGKIWIKRTKTQKISCDLVLNYLSDQILKLIILRFYLNLNFNKYYNSIKICINKKVSTSLTKPRAYFSNEHALYDPYNIIRSYRVDGLLFLIGLWHVVWICHLICD